MKSFGFCLWAVFVSVIFFGNAGAQTAPVNIMAGPAQSTILQVGQEIGDMGRACGMQTRVYESSGALDNLLAVKKRTYTQFGLIQHDVLEYLHTYQPDVPDISNALRGIKIAFPLFPQEVHVLALAEIEGLADLDGRVVSIGDRNSGTFLTATVMLDLVSAIPAEKRELTPDAALAALKKGEIDAMFFVDGAPSPLFEDPEIALAGLRLLPASEPILQAVYETGVIASDVYEFTAEDVPVVTVQAIMVAYDYVPRGRNRYNTANCNMVAAISSMVHARLEDLRATGHPKWAEVDPSAIVPDFDVSICAGRGIEQGVALQCR